MNWREKFTSTRGRFGDHLRDIFPQNVIRGVEVGTGTASHTLRMLKAHPGLHLYAIDAWDLPNPSYRAERSICSRKMAKPVFAGKVLVKAMSALAPFKVRCVVLPGLSPEVARRFPPAQLDFVYLDGCHLPEAVLADIDGWLPKIRRGGYIAGHDYSRKHWPGLVAQVNDLSRRLGLPVLTKPGAQPGGPEWLLGPLEG